MMLEVILVISPLFTLFISLIPKRIPKRIRFEDSGQTTTITSSRWRRFWRSWIPIPTSVGVTVLAVLQWRRIQTGGYAAKDWEITCYRAIPCRALSRAWGWVSNCRLPGPVRCYIYGLYSSLYGVNLDEMARDMKYYPSLAKFFTRELKEGVRPIDPSDCIVSPADGRVLNCGKVCSCHVEQIKGVTYKIQTFLGEPSWLGREERAKKTDENDNEVLPQYDVTGVPKAKDVPDITQGANLWNFMFSGERQKKIAGDEWNSYKKLLLRNPNNELYQMVVYLAPGDYHRFHSPIQWRVNFRRHFQGELLSVNPIIAGWIPELFSLNERVVYVGEWEHGFFSMTAVGATNVGSIRVYCDKSLQTNTKKWKNGVRHKDIPLNVVWKKGEEVGEFRMGSTIVLLFEAPSGYKFNTDPNQRVLVGQSLCCTGCTSKNTKS